MLAHQAHNPMSPLRKIKILEMQYYIENNGDYVLLSKGYTYYEEANRESTKGNIILVHGFSVPSYIWEVTFNTLKEKGISRCDDGFIWARKFR